MNHLEFFLREHATVHSKEAAPADFNMEWPFEGLTDAQLRTLPHGMSSIAWLLWHMARVEDACCSRVVFREPQLLDDAWVARLGVDHRETDGEGMSKEQVGELSAAIDLAALREYRNAVCRRTRTLATGMWPDRWSEPLTEADAGDMPWLAGKPRESLLTWWAVQHSHYHLGQAAMLRGVLPTEARRSAPPASGR